MVSYLKREPVKFFCKTFCNPFLLWINSLCTNICNRVSRCGKKSLVSYCKVLMTRLTQIFHFTCLKMRVNFGDQSIFLWQNKLIVVIFLLSPTFRIGKSYWRLVAIFRTNYVRWATPSCIDSYNGQSDFRSMPNYPWKFTPGFLPTSELKKKLQFNSYLKQGLTKM